MNTVVSTRNTIRLSDSPRGIRAGAALLRRGGLVAFPTETVYGLGADARVESAVAGIYAAKGRPSFNPLIVHVADLAAAEALADFHAPARALAEAFWPGPLTLVLPRRARLAEAVTAGLPTLAIRIPAAPVAQALLREFGGPVAAPSANVSGRVSPTTADHVLEGLSGRIDGVIDGGPCAVGLESTIVGFDGDAPTLLRPGGLPAEAIARVLGDVASAPDAILSPGMMKSHYAPGARLRLNAERPAPGEGWLGFGPAPVGPAVALRNLSPDADLSQAAMTLFAALRELDAEMGGQGVIAVAPIPDHGLGRAINDRLIRAAAPRNQ